MEKTAASPEKMQRKMNTANQVLESIVFPAITAATMPAVSSVNSGIGLRLSVWEVTT